MRKTSRLERLAKKEEKDIVKRIFFLSIVSLFLAIFIFTFGVNLLGKFTDFLGIFFKGKDTNSSSNDALRAPILDSLPDATNSAKLIVTGFSDEGITVEIYLDSDKATSVENSRGKFTSEEISLNNGENKLYAKAVNSRGEQSPASDELTIKLDTKEPTLEIEIPVEGQAFSGDNRIRVLGKTDSDSQIYANGFLASVNSDGRFEVFVPVAEGETTIEIKAIDEAGNTKVELRKINYHK